MTGDVDAVLKLVTALADTQTMPDASDLADASVAPSPPPPLMPMPTGPPADVMPPGPPLELPPRPVLKLPTLARSGAAGPTSGETAAEAPLDPIAAAAAAAASSSNPHAMAAAAHFATMRQAAAMPSVKPVRGRKKRRSRRPLVVKVLVLGLLGGAGYLGRDTAFATRLKGDGYDSSILPMIVYERPNPGTVDGTMIRYEVIVENGVASHAESFIDFVTHPSTSDSILEVRQTWNSVENGALVDPPLSISTRDLIMIGDESYGEPTEVGAPWERAARLDQLPLSGKATVWMYQDVIDHSLRRVAPLSVTDETIARVEVTTYDWAIPSGEFRRSAPFAAEMFPISEVAAPDSPVTLTISVDAAGLVRVFDVALELDAVLQRAIAEGDGAYYYRRHYELDSIEDAAPTITAPTNVEPAAADGEGG